MEKVLKFFSVSSEPPGKKNKRNDSFTRQSWVLREMASEFLSRLICLALATEFFKRGISYPLFVKDLNLPDLL